MSLVLKKIAIKDPEGTDVVVLSNISDGVDGAASFGFTLEQESVQIEDMQTVDHSQTGTLDVKVLRAPTADLAKINALIGKRVELSGIGIDGFLLFADNPVLSRNPDFDSDVLNDQIYVTERAVRGYRSTGTQAFYGGRNAFGLWNHADIDATIAQSGWVALTGAGTSDYVTGILQLELVDGDSTIESRAFLCPFVGDTVIGSIKPISITEGSYRLGIRFYQANGTTEVSTVWSNTYTTGTPRKSVTATVPANAVYARLVIDGVALDFAGTFHQPALTTTTTTYVP